MLTLRRALLALPLVTLACSTSSSAPTNASAPDSGSRGHEDGAATVEGGDLGDAAPEAASDGASDADAGTQDGCAVYFAALSAAQTLGAACFGEAGSSPLDAGNQPSLCEMELGSTACSTADRASFGGDAVALADCVSSLGACDAPDESSWLTSESACRAAFGSGLTVSSACQQALYVAGF